MPPKGKKLHDKRHDTGLAAPGKRISKDRSSVATNGHVNGKQTQPSAATSQSNKGLAPGLHDHRPELVAADSEGSQSAGDQGPLLGQDPKEHDYSYTINGISSQLQSNMVDKETEAVGLETSCSKDVPSFKAMASQASSSLALAATILSACPLRDAIAILILLLSLPPTLIIIIHTLFASLTFLPPATGLSLSAGATIPSLGDWFHATPGGGPSPFTIVIADAIMTMIYLICPLHLQNVFMDLGQAVIAISLSGAAAGTGSSSRSVAFCSFIILMSHLFRYKALHATMTNGLGNVLRQVGLETLQERLALPGATVSDPVVYSWPRLFLGCHILAQGLLTLIRRWFAGAAQKKQTSKLEAEQASLSTSGKLAMLQLESNEGAGNSSTDGRPPGPPPIARESKDKISISKKKRRQANQARSQQPLWAAIASTKVTFMKELEHKQLSHDAAEAAQTSASSESFSTLVHLDDRAWVTDISPTNIRFKADISLTVLEQADKISSETITGGRSYQRPFFVRLNGADWASSRMVEEGESGSGKLWKVEVYGLSPMTRYTCEVIRTDDDKVLSSMNVVTLPAPYTEQAVATIPVAPPHQALRTLSPNSTLKHSVSAAEAKREELRTRLKRIRKDHKSAASTIRREIEQLQGKVASSGGQDDRSNARIQTAKQNIKQAEDATEAIRAEIDNLGEVPQADVDAANARRKSFEAAAESKRSAKAALDNARAIANKELAAARAEIASVAQKRERLTARRTKINESIERLESEQTASTSAKQQQDFVRSQKRDERAQVINRYMEWVNATRFEAEDLNIRANHLFQDIQAAERSAMSLPNYQQQPPTTPEGNLPGTNGPLTQSTQPFEFVPFGPAPSMHSQMPSFNSHATPAPWNGAVNGHTGRQRSSSMYSGYSGFTEDMIEPPQYSMHQGNGTGRKGSEGSKGSGGSSMGEGMTSWAQAPAFASAVGSGQIRPPSTDFKGKGGPTG